MGSLRADAYYYTEKTIFEKLPSLRALLSSRYFERDFCRELDDDIHYNARRFALSTDASFFDRADHERYQQCKIGRSLNLQAVDAANEIKLGKDLFDGEECD